MAALSAIYEYTRLHLPRLDRQLRTQLRYGYGPAAAPGGPATAAMSRRASAFGPSVGLGAGDAESLLVNPGPTGSRSPTLAGLSGRLTAAAGTQGVS